MSKPAQTIIYPFPCEHGVGELLLPADLTAAEAERLAAFAAALVQDRERDRGVLRDADDGARVGY